MEGPEQEAENTLNEMSLFSGSLFTKSLKNEYECRCVVEGPADTSVPVGLFPGY